MEYVLIRTTKGDIVLELNREKAPETVENFLRYVEAKFYEETVFHRVIKGFMIQGGGLSRSLARKPTDAPIKNEAGNGLSNDRGTIAMARTGDPHSATSQFFINTVDNTGLNQDMAAGNWGYAVFGKVIGGMKTVDAIEGVDTTQVGQHGDVPLEPVVIQEARHLPAEDAKKKAEEIDAGS